MNDLLFRILAALIIVIMLAISGSHRRRADRVNGGAVSLKEEGLAITIPLRLLGAALWLSVFAYLINPAWVAFGRIDLPEWARWLGIAMGVASDFLAYWIFTNLGNNVTPTVVTRQTHALVTTGPYRWVRHPLYSMGAMAFFGFALVAENWSIALLGALTFIVLAVRTRKEEANLIQRFGDEYRAYMRRTGRFLPLA
jgi:protein-S-isoprenylcysteine O-methyltransferase Ste14